MRGYHAGKPAFVARCFDCRVRVKVRITLVLCVVTVLLFRWKQDIDFLNMVLLVLVLRFERVPLVKRTHTWLEDALD